MTMTAKSRLWTARAMLAIVTGWNLQAALVFILWPGRFAPGFELTGVPGAVAVRGIGILFLMWNVPYLVALLHPRKHLPLLGIAIVMQSIGLVGESMILFSLPDGHAILSGSISRFILFDASGLILLVGVLYIIRKIV
jgi:hypothetical protein